MTYNISRRSFFGGTGELALIAGMLGGTACCREVEQTESVSLPRPTKETMFEQYIGKLREILVAFMTGEEETIGRAADLAVQCYDKGGKLYAALIGHLFAYQDGGEIAEHRIGNPGLFIMRTHFSLDTEELAPGDFLLTMVPTEAKKAKEKGVWCVGLTSPYFKNEDTPPLALHDNPPSVLRNPEGLTLTEICDITINCHCPYTDGLLYSDRLSVEAIPSAGHITIMFYWALVGSIIERLAKKGIFPVVTG